MIETIYTKHIYPTYAGETALFKTIVVMLVIQRFGVVTLPKLQMYLWSLKNEENRNIRTIIQVVDKGIVFKNGSMDGSDIRIPYNQIIKMELFGEKNNNQGLLTLLRNKRVIIVPKLLDKKQSEIILTHLMNIINERALGIKYEEPGWGLETERIDSDSELVRLDNSQVSELERLTNLFDKGFLTDDEFKNMKKKIIEN